MNAAREAGRRLITTGWGYNAVTTLEATQPDRLLHSPKELPSYIRAIDRHVSARTLR